MDQWFRRSLISPSGGRGRRTDRRGRGFQERPQVKNSHIAELGIAIKKGARGQGLGRAMLEDGIGWARTTGIHKLFLGVFETNDRAIALYRSLGFQEEARLKGQVVLRGKPADLVLMALWL